MNPVSNDILDLESILLGDTGYGSATSLYHLPPHIPTHIPPQHLPHHISHPFTTPMMDTSVSLPMNVTPTSPYHRSPPSLLATPSPPSLATPSPPSNHSPPSELGETKREDGSLKQKKRRKKEESGEEIYSEGFSWADTSHVEFSNRFPVVDRISMQLSHEIQNIVLKRFEASSQFSPSDNAWICYRQNQFKITCHYPKLTDVNNLAIIDNNELIPIVQLFAKLCAIKENIGRTPLNQVAYVGIQHVGKKRTKKDKSDLSPVPFVAGRAEFTNMQFEKSNFIRGQQLECFHLVLLVIAQASNQKCYQILSKVSPRLIVRAQNPGFYEDNTPSPPNVTSDVNTNTIPESLLDPKEQAFMPPRPPLPTLPALPMPNIPQEKMLIPQPEVVVKREDVSIFSGKVGINTSFPTEALTVDGNILVTGNYLKPSDKRIKSSVEFVNTLDQLDNIRRLKLYDYNVSSRRERGVFAQELLEVMPSAVYRAGDVMYDGSLIPDFLVVNERALLYENIGATKQLDANLEKEKDNVEQLGVAVEELKEHDKQTDKKLSALQRAIGFLVQEEPRKRKGREDSDDFEGPISMFNLGPARTILLLGFFLPWIWLAGIPYMFSHIALRCVAGFLNTIMFGLWMALRFLREDQLPTRHRIVAQFVLFCFGLLLCFILRLVRDKDPSAQQRYKRQVQMKELQSVSISSQTPLRP